MYHSPENEKDENMGQENYLPGKANTLPATQTTSYSKTGYQSYKKVDDFIKFRKTDFKIDSLLERLYLTQSASGNEDLMISLVLSELKKIKGLTVTEDDKNNIFVTKGLIDEGQNYPCIVAHMDTVFKIIPNQILIDKRINDKNEKLVRGYINTVSTPHGLGADDKNGIYIALKLLQEQKVVKAAFFVEEEIGCIGSRHADLEFFKDCGYILQGDRRNGGDLITDYNFDSTCSKDFLEKISKISKHFGYKEANGSYTDALILAERGVNVSCMNFSVGYYDPHMDTEYTNINELNNAYKYIINLLDILGNKRYEHKYEDSYYANYYQTHKAGGTAHHAASYGKYSNFYDWYDDDNITDPYNFKEQFCTCTRLDVANKLIDMNCEICNPLTNTFTDTVCSCGFEMVQREFTFHCPNCNTHKLINFYKY